MGSALFGSAPKASFSTQSTLNPFQENIFNVLNGLFGTGGELLDRAGGAGANTLAGRSLAALEQQALGVPTGPSAQQTGATNQAFDALSSALGYKAPKIDATDAFQRGVVQPMTTDFLERALPAIAGEQGRSAGGAFSSGGVAARRNAATDFERNLAGIGSQYSLGAETANQTADINAQKNVLAALGIAPTAATMPEQILGSNVALASSTFAPYQQILADMIATATSPTVQTLGVGSGGSTGLLGGLLGGVGNFLGGSGGSALIGSLFSDERLKEDIEEVGSVDGFPLYKFKYKGVPGKRLGLMASDVEKRLPSAVGSVDGFKTVDYGAVLEDVLKEAA